MNRKSLTQAAVLAQKGAHLFVTTADPEGYPHVAPAARMKVIPGRGKVELEAWFCPGTLGNLERNDRVDLVVWAPGLNEGYQLLGRNEAVEEIAILDGYDASAIENFQIPQVERRLKIRVEKVLPFRRGAHRDEEED
jgi:hypothetical protein